MAKEAAEHAGYRVLHALVDSLYVERRGARREDYSRMAQEIERQTGLPMALEAVYRYVVFLPSKQASVFHGFLPTLSFRCAYTVFGRLLSLATPTVSPLEGRVF